MGTRRGGRGKQTSAFALYRHDRAPLPGQLINNGLVLYYDFGNGLSYGGTGTSVTDLSSSSNTGTLTNGPTFSTVNDGVLVLDGTNDYVSAGNPSSLNVTTWTIMAWVRPTNFANYRNVFYKGDGSGAQYGIIIDGTGDWTCQPNTNFSGDKLTLNQWVMLAGTSTGTVSSTYRNGLFIRSQTISSTSKGTVVSIGADTVFTRYFRGEIGVAAIYNRALDSSELTQNFEVFRGRYGV